MAYPSQPPNSPPPRAPMSATVSRSYSSQHRAPPHTCPRRGTSMFYTPRPKNPGVGKIYSKKSRLSLQSQRAVSGIMPQISELVNEKRSFLPPSVKRTPSAFASRSTLHSTLTPRQQPHMLQSSRSPYGSQHCLPTPIAEYDIQDTSPQILPSPSSIYYPSPLLNQSQSQRAPIPQKPSPRMSSHAPIPAVSANPDYPYQQFFPARPSNAIRRPLPLSIESSLPESSFEIPFDTDSYTTSSKRSSSLRSASLDSAPYPYDQLMAIPEESDSSVVVDPGVLVRPSRSDPTPLSRTPLPPGRPLSPAAPSRIARPTAADLPSLLISALPNFSMLEVAIRQIKNELLSQNAAALPSTVGLIFVIVTLFFFYTNMSRVGFE